VGRDNALNFTHTTTNTYCPGTATGSITATVTNGIGPFTYTLNGGLPVTGASPHTFSGLSMGTHTLKIADATGCLSNTISIDVYDGPALASTNTAFGTSCNNATDGRIRVTPLS